MTQALILVDMQNDYFPGGAMELVGMTEAASNARTILESFRAADRPIFHIQHLSARPGATFFIPETEGVKHNPSVAPRDGESVVQKSFPNALRDTDLEELLREAGIDHAVIVGAMSHMCIDATTRAAFDAGFQCTVVEDACATRDLAFKDKVLAAAEVHGAFMAALSAPYASVVSTVDFLEA